MTFADTAFDIASRFFDSGPKRNDLELAILRHMEHHAANAAAAENEACARIADAAIHAAKLLSAQPGADKATEMQMITMEAAMKNTATEIATRIRSRNR